jgi:2-polyprenyl-6-methoxyphenol hydroxylase-like FAD-dependent oxidoreductase
LIGDAAHAVHPLAGLGLNLGLLDCAALVAVFEDARGAGYFGELRMLRRYERWRRSENLLAAGALDGLERLFSNANPITSAVRSLGLAAVGRMPMIKRDLGLRALGLRGDVPQFLKADQAWPHK